MSAEFTSKEGFSVVAPMKTMVPSSTWGRKASCWALLNRCTSSTKRTVPRPIARFDRAASTAARMSLTPARTAESPMKSASGRLRGEPGKGGLAGARWSPQDHRVDAPAVEREAKRLALSDEVRLAGELRERTGAEPVRERRRRSAQVTRLERRRHPAEGRTGTARRQGADCIRRRRSRSGCSGRTRLPSRLPGPRLPEGRSGGPGTPRRRPRGTSWNQSTPRTDSRAATRKCSPTRSGPASSAAGVPSRAVPAGRTVTCASSMSYHQSCVPSETMTCGVGAS